MENHHCDHIKVLAMNMSCCEHCPKKLKKKLLKMPGVDSVSIDTEEGLVFLRGMIDATTLVNNIAKLGKKVQLLPSNKHPKKHVEEKHKHSRDKYSSAREKGKMHKNYYCQGGPKKEEEEEHICEAYVPPTVDQRVCRDYYCKVHPQMRKIVNNVPADSSSWFGGLPGFGPYAGGSYTYPSWYGEEPPRFGYRPHPRMLPHPFGFQ